MLHIAPDEAAADAVRALLREHNEHSNPTFWRKLIDPEYSAQPLQVTATGPDGEVVGGLLAETTFSWLRISAMAVREDMRRQGIGRRLLEAAENAAVARGCRYAYVDTMSYQAPDFYRGCGYETAGRLPDWDSHGHDKLFFIKRLADGTELASQGGVVSSTS